LCGFGERTSGSTPSLRDWMQQRLRSIALWRNFPAGDS
jgi:hypothetical protein